RQLQSKPGWWCKHQASQFEAKDLWPAHSHFEQKDGYFAESLNHYISTKNADAAARLMLDVLCVRTYRGAVATDGYITTVLERLPHAMDCFCNINPEHPFKNAYLELVNDGAPPVVNRNWPDYGFWEAVSFVSATV